MPRNIPIVPLRTVLMPLMMVPLHFFEERYKRLVEERLDTGEPFLGIALLRSGEEVEGPAVPHSVGTLAQLLRVSRLPNGDYLVHALGERRFQIRRIVLETPVIVADVEWLEDGDLEEMEEYRQTIEELRALGGRYLQWIAEAWEVPMEELPEEPAAMGWFLAGRLPLTPAQGQALLESTSLRQRLEALLHFLQRSGAQLEENIALIGRIRRVRKGNGKPFPA